MNWNPYLQSICDTYAEWWNFYTLTDVVGKQRDGQKKRIHLLGLIVEKVKQEHEEETERLTVLEGLRKYAENHVLLIGRPGSGKSTALVRLLLESAKAVIAREAERNETIPSIIRKNEKISVLVELRYYQTSIIDLIRDFLKRHQILLSNCEIEQMLFDGQFSLLVDGVNELPSEAARGDLQKFHQDYRNTTPMVFTTRDLGVGGDLGIEQKLQMQPLTEEQMGEFVCGYLPEQGEEMLKQLSGRLRELGETPLLLWMLCSVFVDNQNQVPANLGSVFRRFTEIYNNKLKQDIPVSDESRRWWRRLLQHLAWVMTKGESKTEILVAIPKQQARDILTQFLKEQDYHQPRDSEVWLDDLLKHHLIQLGTDNKIEFRHQLLQEYYAAERLLQELPSLSDEQLQWDYLNYLKWTEPIALMMQLVDKQSQAVHVVKLALAVDWQLGARLAGEVRFEWQKKTVGLVEDLNLPALLSIRLLEKTKSDACLPILIKLLQDKYSYVRSHATDALLAIKSKTSIPRLTQLLHNEDSDIHSRATFIIKTIQSGIAIPLLQFSEQDPQALISEDLKRINTEMTNTELIQLLEYEDSSVLRSAAFALGKIKSDKTMMNLLKILNNRNFLHKNNGKNTLSTLDALEKIQQHLKYYKPIPKSTMSKSISQKTDSAAIIEILQNIYQRVEKMSEHSQNSKYSFNNPESVQIIEQNHGQVTGKNIEANKRSLVEAEKEIRGLLEQLSHNYPITTKYEKEVFINQFNQEIKTNSRIRNIILAGGIELIKVICPPLGIPIEMGKKWLEAAEKSMLKE